MNTGARLAPTRDLYPHGLRAYLAVLGAECSAYAAKDALESLADIKILDFMWGIDGPAARTAARFRSAHLPRGAATSDIVRDRRQAPVP